MTRTAMLAAAAVSALTLSFGATAGAVTIYSLNTGNSDISGYPGPYGSVSVNLVDPTTADVTFTATSAGQFDYFFIDGGAADVNVDATSWSITNLVTNGGGSLSDGGSGNVDGFGLFNQTTDQTDGYNDRATTISFTLNDTSGTWASSDSVLAANPKGFFVGAHIGVCDTTTNPTCASTPGAVATGFAAGAAVPEPVTWAMMVLGFGGIGAVMRARRARNAALAARQA